MSQPLPFRGRLHSAAGIPQCQLKISPPRKALECPRGGMVQQGLALRAFENVPPGYHANTVEPSVHG